MRSRDSLPKDIQEL